MEKPPELDELIGETGRTAREQTTTEMAHNLRLWRAVLARGQGD